MIACSLVCNVEDLLLALQAAVGHLERWLVEGLRLVEVVAVAGTDLISVLVLLSPPGCAVPGLPVARVATRTGVRLRSNLQLRVVIKGDSSVAGAPDRVVVHLGVEEGVPHGSAVIVLRLEVPGSVLHGPGTVATASHFHGHVVPRNKLPVCSN